MTAGTPVTSAPPSPVRCSSNVARGSRAEALPACHSANRTATANYAITNNGTVPDRYDWTYNDTQGWTGGPVSGTTAVLDPGQSEQVTVTATLPLACSYPASSSTVTFTATPVGAPYDGKSCTSVVSFTPMAFEFSPNTLNLRSSGMWVTGVLTPSTPYTPADINIGSIRLNGVPVDPDTKDRRPTQAALAEITAYRDRRFPLLKGAPLTETRICQYENSSNGDFLIDFHPRLENREALDSLRRPARHLGH